MGLILMLRILQIVKPFHLDAVKNVKVLYLGSGSTSCGSVGSADGNQSGVCIYDCDSDSSDEEEFLERVVEPSLKRFKRSR